MMKYAIVAVLLALFATAQAMDMRGLKKTNKAYLERTQQKPHVPFDEDKYLLSIGKVSRRHLMSMGLTETEENIAAAHRQLTYFNESRWQTAEPWTDPEVTADSTCPGAELYGSFGTSYICPMQVQKDCATEADEFSSMDNDGNPMPTEGTWNVFPTAMRGNWDDADYWTIPVPMGKFISDYEGMCENGEVFNTVTHPACIPRGVELPFATLCVFNRIYKLDYNALWYFWYAWSEYSDAAEIVTRSATVASDGTGATTALYNARIFIPSPPTPGSRRHLLQDGAAAPSAAPAPTEDGQPVQNMLSTAGKGGDIESLQNLLDTTGLGASPTIVFPPPTPAAPWAPSGNGTNTTAV